LRWVLTRAMRIGRPIGLRVLIQRGQMRSPWWCGMRGRAPALLSAWRAQCRSLTASANREIWPWTVVRVRSGNQDLTAVQTSMLARLLWTGIHACRSMKKKEAGIHHNTNRSDVNSISLAINLITAYC
jgi:hypothetical protein